MERAVTFDEIYAGVYLDVIHKEDFIYSSGFIGFCDACGRLTRWTSVLYECYACSEVCIRVLDRRGYFDFLESD